MAFGEDVMHPYGLDRRSTVRRYLRRTRKPCPCCLPTKQAVNPRSLRKRARQQGKREARED